MTIPTIEFWHIVLALFAYGIFGVAAIHSIIMLCELHWLKTSPAHPWLNRLPPIETLQSRMFRSIMLGFVSLTIAIVLGVVFFEQGGHLVFGKGSITLLAWAVYACLLASHYKLGIKMRVGAIWTLLAFIGLTLAYFGTKLIA